MCAANWSATPAVLGGDEDVAARDVDLVGKRERDGVAAMGDLQIAVGGDDARDLVRLPDGCDHDLVAA